MNQFPDDLKAIEFSLSQLMPRSDLDPDQLIYCAGYEAALLEHSQRRGSLKMFASALVGAAAMWIGSLVLLPNDVETESEPAKVVAVADESDLLNLVAVDIDSPDDEPRRTVEAFDVSTSRKLSTLGFRYPSWRPEARPPSEEQVDAMEPMRRRENLDVRRANLQWQRSLLNNKPHNPKEQA